MLLGILFSGIMLSVIILILIFFYAPFLIGAPFQPSSTLNTRRMVEFSGVKSGDCVAELGSGGGKVVMAMARKGAEVHGYEINPFLVLLSRRAIKKEGLQKKAFIHWRNFWSVNFRKFDVVSVFQIGYIMRKLERKLNRELRKGARVVSNTWKFPNWKLVKKEGGVYLYKK